MIQRTQGYMPTEDGENIWYETAGEGFPVVFGHGLGGNAAVWYQQLPYFARRYTAVTWDQRGFGRSSNQAGKAGPQAAVADLFALLDHLELESAHLVGQSMGGWAVLGTALASPDRVRSLVLACTNAGIPPVDEPPFDPSLVAAPPTTRPLGQHPAVGERLPSLDLARAYLYQALGTFGDRPPDGELAALLAATTYDTEALASLEIPVLLVCGSEDALMTPALIRDAAKRLPKAEVVVMPDRGHSPYFEDPDTWNTVVHTFLSSVP